MGSKRYSTKTGTGHGKVTRGVALPPKKEVTKVTLVTGTGHK